VKSLKIELHLLQNFPPSCLNRDDTNTPKTCEFGGVTRARVSSQCWKRAVREHSGRDGVRSKRLVGELVKKLADKGVGTPETLAVPVTCFVSNVFSEMDKGHPGETKVLVFYSPTEFNAMVNILSDPDTLAELSREAPVLKKGEIEKKLKACLLATDIALFGRMLAGKPEYEIDAACQVAHAISTHGVNLELDFFTAVDDLKDKTANDDAGAGMLGTVGYDSACYYRYALVDYVQLSKNLNNSIEDIDASIEFFMNAFCDAIPIAKKNSFAHGNPPFLAFFVVRQSGTPASLVNAFACPVDVRRGNLLEDSARALAKHAGRLDSCYELYTNPALPGEVKTFLAHILEASELAGLPTQDNLSMRKAVAGVMETVKSFREEQPV
jgi:CRISPR system Cascade subunit CasC